MVTITISFKKYSCVLLQKENKKYKKKIKEPYKENRKHKKDKLKGQRKQTEIPQMVEK